MGAREQDLGPASLAPGKAGLAILLALLLTLVPATGALAGKRVKQDRSFGKNGVVLLKSIKGGTTFPSVSFDAKRRIIMGAWSKKELVVWRLKPSGRPDRSFGRRGQATISLPKDERLLEIEAQPDGKILAVGNRGADFAVRRLDERGRPDPSFNGGKPLVLGLPQHRIVLSHIEVLDDGRLLAGGVAAAETHKFFLLQLLEDGSLDPSFGETAGDGRRTGYSMRQVGDTADQGIAAMLVAPDGSIVAGGQVYARFEGDRSPIEYAALVRYTPDGLPAEFAGLQDGGWFSWIAKIDGLGLGPDGETFTMMDFDRAYRFKIDGRDDDDFGGRFEKFDIVDKAFPISSFAPDGTLVTATLTPAKRGKRRRGFEFQFGANRYSDGARIRNLGKRGTEVLRVGPPVKKVRFNYDTADTEATNSVAVSSAVLKFGKRHYVAVGKVKLPASRTAARGLSATPNWPTRALSAPAASPPAGPAPKLAP